MQLMENEKALTFNQLLTKLQTINLTVLKGRLERGAILQHIKNNKLYVNYDSWVERWSDFLDCINLNRETARQDIEIFQEFSYYLTTNPLLLQKCSYERLIRLLPVVREKKKDNHSVDLMPLLEMSVNTNRKDFDNNIKEMRGLIPDDQCINPQICDAPKMVFERCGVCGVTYRRKDLEDG